MAGILGRPATSSLDRLGSALLYVSQFLRRRIYAGRVHAEQMAEDMPLVDLDTSALAAARLLAERRLPALVVTEADGSPLRSSRPLKSSGSWCPAMFRTTRRWLG
jgi:CBS domain-containing protein